jgi:hypothetical protein
VRKMVPVSEVRPADARVWVGIVRGVPESVVRVWDDVGRPD